MKWDHELLQGLAEVAGIHPNYLQHKVREILRKCPRVRKELEERTSEPRGTSEK
jgi:hypothetical protein